MKKILAAIQIFLIVMSLAACGGNKAPQSTDNTPSTTAENATTQPESTQTPEETETKQPEDPYVLKMVEITMDNWQEYFELAAVESPAYYLVNNMGINPDSCRYFEYELRLKDEYAHQYLEHGSYGYPEASGISLDSIGVITASGEGWINEEAAVSFAYTVKADAAFINKILYIYTEAAKGPAEITGEDALKKGAFLRYVMAKDNSFETDKNDYFLHVLTPLSKTFAAIAKDADLSQYGWTDEPSVAFFENTVEVTITDISGVIPTWVEK